MGNKCPTGTVPHGARQEVQQTPIEFRVTLAYGLAVLHLVERLNGLAPGGAGQRHALGGAPQRS